MTEQHPPSQAERKGMGLQLPEEQKLDLQDSIDNSAETAPTPVEIPEALQYWLLDGALTHTPPSQLPLHRSVDISMEEGDYPKGFVSHNRQQGQEVYFPVERALCYQQSGHHHSQKSHQVLSMPSGRDTVEKQDLSACSRHLATPTIAERLGSSSTSRSNSGNMHKLLDTDDSPTPTPTPTPKQLPGRFKQDPELQAVSDGRQSSLRHEAVESLPVAPVPLHDHRHTRSHQSSHTPHNHISASSSPRSSQGRNGSGFGSPPLPPQAVWIPTELEDFFADDSAHYDAHRHSVSPLSDVDSPPLPHCPERPFSLVRTHFLIQLQASACVWDLIQLIHQCLSNFSQYDFSFIDKSTLWKGKYIRGSQCCMIYINLYYELEREHAFVVEVVKVFGDSKPFCDFFREFRDLMTQHQSSNTEGEEEEERIHSEGANKNNIVHRVQAWGESPSFSSSQSSCHRFSPLDGKWRGNMSHEEFLYKIEPICKMESSPYYETKLEAAKMLADLAHLDPHMLNDEYCIREIVRILDRLILQSGFAMVKEQAIIALAIFVEIPGYAAMILQQSEAIPLLLSLVSNPCDVKKAYETAQLRRESARIIEQLVAYDAKEFTRYLERRNLSLLIWLERIEDIEDLRTKLSAKRTKQMLIHKCFPQLKDAAAAYCFSPVHALYAASGFPFSPTSKAVK